MTASAKDDVATSQESWQHKLRRRYADNGLLWTMYHLLSRTSGLFSRFFETKSRDLEREREKPGEHSIEKNRILWSSHDWSRGGEEWSPSPEWRRALIDEFVTPNLAQGATVVEIGPGGGRWTEELHRQAGHLYLLDITSTTLDICRAKLAGSANVSYIETDGLSLAGVPASSVDFIWSFDVFVHIAPAQQRAYLADILRVLRPEGRAVIHHAGDGGMSGGWRSAMTSELFRRMLTELGLRLIKQTESWGPNGEFRCSEAGDVITVFST